MQELRNQLDRWVFPVHRLDRGTSGVLLFAFDSESAQRMAKVFEEGKAGKNYLSVVRGYLPEAGVIDYALREEKHKPLQEAVTEFTRLATVELPIAVGRYATSRYSLVEAKPLTGRMHQIRKHFAHLCHYVVGDKKHGDWRHNKMFAEELDNPFMLLHSRFLSFMHPYSGEPIIIEAPLPDHWHLLLHRFGWTERI